MGGPRGTQLSIYSSTAVRGIVPVLSARSTVRTNRILYVSTNLLLLLLLVRVRNAYRFGAHLD